MSLTKDIKDYALDIGFCRVGITTAERFSEYIADVHSREGIYDFLIDDPRQILTGADPMSIMPGAKSIISVAFDYTREAFPESLLRLIGRTYLARSYGPPPDRINGARIKLLAEFLRKMGCQVGQGIFLPERYCAARSGIVTYGKNNFAYVSAVGSFVILSSFVVDIDLEYDMPTLEVRCPESCDLCLKACPTGAIYEPLRLNPRRCISFNNWWTQDGRPHASSLIPRDIRKQIGIRIHGCDKCQEACPHNQKRLKASLPMNEYLAAVENDFTLSNLLNMSDEFFRKRVQPLMYNYIKEKKYFQRNAAIAIGNLGDSSLIPDLARAMEDPEPMVRAYSAWALGRLGGGHAWRILEGALAKETAEMPKAEIKAALEG